MHCELSCGQKGLKGNRVNPYRPYSLDNLSLAVFRQHPAPCHAHYMDDFAAEKDRLMVFH